MSSTRIVKVDSLNPREDYLKEAAKILKDGGLVIIPTETVYGIAANMLDKKAVDKLYEIKQRPKDKPFSLHIDKKEKIGDFARDIPPSAYKLMDKFWPGPLTLVLKREDKLISYAQGLGENSIGTSTSLECHGKRSRTIGIRMPDDYIALEIIREANVPIVCPSANISGKTAPTNFPDAIKDLNGLVSFAIDAGTTKLQLESSVVDLTAEPLRILREGAIKKEDIEAVVRKKVILFVCTGNSCRSVMAEMLLKKKLREKNREDVEVLSRGVMMLCGLGATDTTRELLKREGIDVSGHCSQEITTSVINKSDIILVMERLHEKRILELAPEAKNRVFLLKELTKINDGNLDIADPIGRREEFYAETFKIIKEAVERIIDII